METLAEDEISRESQISYCPMEHDTAAKAISNEIGNQSADFEHETRSNPSEFLVDTSYCLSGPVLLILIIFGLCGNIVCLSILSRPKRRPRVNVYLMTLAGWDWILVASSFFVYNLPALAAGAGKNAWEWATFIYALPYLYAVAAMAHNCSIWIVVCLGVERYFALCHPLKHRLWWGGSSMRKGVLLVISIVGVLYSLPRLFETRIDECVERETGNTVLVISESNLQNNTDYRLWYKTIGGMALFSVVPTLTLLTLTIRVAVAMKTRSAALEGIVSKVVDTSIRRKSTRGSVIVEFTADGRSRYGRDSRVSVDTPYNSNTMLIVVVVKFLLCHSLPAILDVCESTMGSKFHHNFLINLLIDLSNDLVVLNSSCNVLIYYVCSQRFRFEMRRRLRSLVRKCSNCLKGPDDVLLHKYRRGTEDHGNSETL